MEVGITRRDLQQELLALSDTMKLELRVEFVKLNKQLEKLERLFVASHSRHQNRKHTSEESIPGSDLVVPTPSCPRTLLSYPEELTDHYFRSFAAGAETEKWEMSHQTSGLLMSQKTSSRGREKQVVDAFQEMDKENGPVQSTFRVRATEFVASPLFNGAISTFIFLNTVTLTVQTDYMARQKLNAVPTAFKVAELAFCVIFALEIILKLIAYRVGYFTDSGWSWNVFDFLLVAVAVVEEMLTAVFSTSFTNFSAMRMLRLLRVVRIIRVVRLLRMIGELRAIVASVLGSLRSLFWTVLLLLSIIYIVGMFLTQLLIEERISGNSDLPGYTLYYGSLGRSILTLYQSVSGGLDWDDAVAPLIDEMSPFYGVMFSCYIAFTILAIMNVVTGVFVESALDSAREDKEIFILSNVRELIQKMIDEGGGAISWETFEENLSNTEMREIFKHIDVDRKEAKCLFRLLDANENGTVDAEEFLNGILRFGGPAKALDVAILMREIKWLISKVQHIGGAEDLVVHEILTEDDCLVKEFGRVLPGA